MGNAGLFEENCAILKKELREGVEILMAKTARAGNGITEGVIWKQLLLYFFPILFGSFFQQLYNTTDAVIVGNFVGKEALAAVGGSTGTLINLLVGFFVGLASGATVIISQFYGGHRDEDVSKAVHTAAAMALGCGALLTVVGIVLSPMLLRMMGTPEDVMDYALTYMRIYFAGMIPNLIYNIGSGVLRAVGDSRRPLYFLIAACLTAALAVTAGEVSGVLRNCGVPEERVEAFQTACGQSFGEGALTPANLIDAKHFAVKTADATIQVDPERSYLVEARVIDGRRYLLVPADESVEVNGVNINIADSEKETATV